MRQDIPLIQPLDESATSEANRRQALAAGSLAHAAHDGLTDVIYVLLPIWQTYFGLSYAQVGLLRGAYAGMMAGFQLLASRGARRWGRETLLIRGTALAGIAYLLAAQATDIGLLLLALMIGGLGASTQHPLASALVSDAYDGSGRVKQALAQYNFAGDVGKAVIPGATGLALAYISWQTSATLLGMIGIAAAIGLWLLVPKTRESVTDKKKITISDKTGTTSGLVALIATGTLDSGVRMGFLTFLPFLLQSKGASTGHIGLALSLLFFGGAFGKLFCGYLGARLGPVRTVICTEVLTALLILLALVLPFGAFMLVMPLIGVALNGTSSVLGGLVPDFAARDRRDRIFAWFYTGTVGGGALAPVLIGAISDKTGVTDGLMVLAGLLLLTLPLCLVIYKSKSGMTRY
ncbi:MFS transporter [Pseudomonas mediterranea]|uniref:MFS transporter n=1 Tax=Pseudomonas mediterranea TaxID=183795 RepID=UPI0006D8A193|nr:MFS transporter [Pseudomonas mediterranea]MDU9031248.1 MFS transporter [Pseudomonas mediterranea]